MAHSSHFNLTTDESFLDATSQYAVVNAACLDFK